MNHGSLDLWQAARSKTGGFVDLGGIEKLRDPASPWNANLAAMSVICASLGKQSSGGYAYNNLWTVGDDEGQGWQATVMDHCVNTMALFGTRWLAHCYGPVGTIGEERSFLGSPPMPGYPDHSTWRYFPVWNRRLDAHLQTVDHKLPTSNVLVIFPVEALYALAGPAADSTAMAIFELLLALVDNHYHVDVLAPSACTGSRWAQGEYLVGESRYRAVITPFMNAQQSKSLCLSRRTQVFSIDSAGRAASDRVLEWLAGITDLRPVLAPKGSWVTMTQYQDGFVVTLSPARHGYRYCGSVSVYGQVVELREECSGLTRILVSADAKTQILTNSADFSL
jgi:hypothetical protein